MKAGSFLLQLVLISTIFIRVSSLKATAQEIAWDSTHRPAIYAPMTEQFRSFPHSPQDIVFLGNSITFWGAWNERLSNLHIKNRGIPGDNTFGVLDRLDEVIAGHPLKVFILIGINDLALHIPDSVILENDVRIIDRIRSGSPSTSIYFQTLLPTNASFNALNSHYHKEAHILSINAGLKRIAADRRVGIIDLYPHFVDNKGNLKKAYTWDGVHLTQEGYNKWVEILKDGHYLN